MTSCSTNTCGIGGWGGPLPGDPNNNSVLTASPAFGGVDVSWSYPTTNPQAVSYVQLYRGLNPDFSLAILLANVGGNFFYDKSTSAEFVEYFYWIKIVSVNGTVGELIGPASAIAISSIGDVIEGLTAKIDAGKLAQSLKTEIAKIALNEQAITQERVARIEGQNAYSALMTQVQAGVDNAYGLLNQEITARQEGESSLVAAIDTAQSVLNGNIASAQTTLQTNIDTVNGVVTEIGALYTAKLSVNGLIGGFGVYNDGTSVQAGFDVDEFWVGRTQANKRKPFIISNDKVYMDQVFIEDASITSLKIGNEAVSVTRYNVFDYSPPQQPTTLTTLSTYTVTIPEAGSFILMCSIGRYLNIQNFVLGTSAIIQEFDVLIDGVRTAFAFNSFSDAAISDTFISKVVNLTQGVHTVAFRYMVNITGSGSLPSSGVTQARIYLFGAHR